MSDDMKRPVTLKEFTPFISQGRGVGIPCYTWPEGKHQVLVRRQEQEGGDSLSHSLYWVFHGENKAREFRIGSLEWFWWASGYSGVL